jgi:glycosyltransferase involved in cell wall biosynthesis
MRFVYHHRTAGRGGEGLHISSVVRALRARSHEVVVVSPPGVDPMSSGDLVPLDKGRARVTGMGRLWKWISRSCPQPVFELLELGYNLVAALRLVPMLAGRTGLVYYERYAFLLCAGVYLARLCGHRVILEVNEVSGVKRARPQFFERLTRSLERFTFRRADEIVTVSSFLQREILSRGGTEGRVHVIPNAVDPARFDRAPRRDEIRSQLGFSEDVVALGFVGWFDKWDRLDRLVGLVDQLRHQHSHVRLMLVGDGPMTDDLRAMAEAKGLTGHMILTGPVPRSEVPDFINAMDVCILPDSNEFGSPIALFEFMACGKPVIAADVGPVRDAVEHAVTGLIVSRTDDGELRRAVAALLKDASLRERLGSAARHRVFERHTWDAVGRAVEQLAGLVPLDLSSSDVNRSPRKASAGGEWI